MDLSRDERIELWGEGPWVDEPDRVLWRAHGLPCLVRRILSGTVCGYVAVPPGHPYHGKSYGAVSDSLLAPGGVTYSEPCNGDDICHVPEPGESDDVFWFGFDCGHMGRDLIPAFARANQMLSNFPRAKELRIFEGTYRTFAFVCDATEFLAEQLANVRRKAAASSSEDHFVARGVLRALIAYRSEWIGDERAKPNPNAAAIEQWRKERSQLAARLRVLDVNRSDYDELARLNETAVDRDYLVLGED